THAQRRLLLPAHLKQQMIVELSVQPRRLSFSGLHCPEVLAVRVIHNVILPRLQTTQFYFSRKWLGWICKEGVIHLAVFFNRVSLRHVIAVYIQISELSFREHLLVIESNPFLPVLFFFRSQRDRLELRPWIRPDKLRSRHSASSYRRSEIRAVLAPAVRAYSRHGG